MGIIKQAVDAEDQAEAPETPGEKPDAEDQAEAPETPGEKPDAEDQAEGPEAGGDALSPQAVRAKMQLPGNLKDAYDRVVLAGMKVMFSKETNGMAMQALQGTGPIEERLGTGIAGLMGLLAKQSNGTMPPQIVIPAGIELLAAMADYLKKSGQEPINDQQIGEAMAVFVQHVLRQAGADTPEKLKEMLQQGGGGMPPGAPQSPAGGAAQAPADASGAADAEDQAEAPETPGEKPDAEDLAEGPEPEGMPPRGKGIIKSQMGG